MQLPPPAGGGRASANALLWLLLLLLLTCFMAGRGVGAEDSLQFCAATVTYQGSGGPSDANFYGSFSLVSNLPRVRGAIRNPNLSPHTQALTRSRSGQNPGSTPFPPIFPHSVRGPFACLPPLSGSLVHPVPCPVQPCPACPTTLPCLSNNLACGLLAAEHYIMAAGVVFHSGGEDPQRAGRVWRPQPRPGGAGTAAGPSRGALRFSSGHRHADSGGCHHKYALPHTPHTHTGGVSWACTHQKTPKLKPAAGPALMKGLSGQLLMTIMRQAVWQVMGATWELGQQRWLCFPWQGSARPT